MRREYHKFYSRFLEREMEMNIYGSGGKPCLVFPAQNGRFFDFENFEMVESAKEYINNQKIQLFCVDSIDEESWSDINGDRNIVFNNKKNITITLLKKQFLLFMK